MTIYTGPVFEMARDQFKVIADQSGDSVRQTRSSAVSQTHSSQSSQ